VGLSLAIYRPWAKVHRVPDVANSHAGARSILPSTHARPSEGARTTTCRRGTADQRYCWVTVGMSRSSHTGVVFTVVESWVHR
jgi:hypothetical protein